MSAALVPVKRLVESKSRMLPQLDAAGREALCLAMLHDLLCALIATPSLDRVAVVTPDSEVAAAAHEAGAEAIHFEEPGLLTAIEHGAGVLRLAPAEPLLVVLGDVAGAVAGDLESLFRELETLGGRGVVLAPSTDGGTSALLRAPADAIPARFGPESAKAHRDEAERAGVPYRELSCPSLLLDLDDARDVERFLAKPDPAGGRETRALLRSL
jgi:2-phospho-L-lactate guanylyltransferase